MIGKNKKFKFKCPQTLGCHSKSNCSADFCVYSQFLSYLVALLPTLHGELCFMAPCLVWLRSSPWSKEAVCKGVPTWKGRTLEIMCWVTWTLGSPLDDSKLASRAFVQLSPSSTRAPRWASKPQRAVVCAPPWVGREAEGAVGLGLVCLYDHVLVKLWVVGNVFWS